MAGWGCGMDERRASGERRGGSYLELGALTPSAGWGWSSALQRSEVSPVFHSRAVKPALKLVRPPASMMNCSERTGRLTATAGPSTTRYRNEAHDHGSRLPPVRLRKVELSRDCLIAGGDYRRGNRRRR